jgi:hypothetical protein
MEVQYFVQCVHFPGVKDAVLCGLATPLDRRITVRFMAWQHQPAATAQSAHYMHTAAPCTQRSLYL